MNKSYFKCLEATNDLIKKYKEIDESLYDTFSEKFYIQHFNHWSSHQFNVLLNLFFHLITNEKDFDKFYSRFNSPGSNDGTKPVAWNNHFIPDEIATIIMSDEDLKEKIKSVKILYNKCKKIEKNFYTESGGKNEKSSYCN